MSPGPGGPSGPPRFPLAVFARRNFFFELARKLQPWATKTMERALQQSTRRIAAEIQRYCTAHPGARDTLEGVMWWVQLQRNEDFKCRIAEAVEWLVKCG